MKQRNMERVKRYAAAATADAARCIYGIVIVAWWALVFLCAMPMLLVWSVVGIIHTNTISGACKSARGKAKLTWRRE